MSDLVSGRTGEWEVVIGLEVHAQVSSSAKLFRVRLQNLVQNQTRMYRWSMRRCQACCPLSTMNVFIRRCGPALA